MRECAAVPQLGTIGSHARKGSGVGRGLLGGELHRGQETGCTSSLPLCKRESKGGGLELESQKGPSPLSASVS